MSKFVIVVSRPGGTERPLRFEDQVVTYPTRAAAQSEADRRAKAAGPLVSYVVQPLRVVIAEQRHKMGLPL
jgi:hypothetical protein